MWYTLLHAYIIVSAELNRDLLYSTDIALTKTNAEYGAKLASGKSSDKSLQKLSWNTDDLEQLNEQGRKLLVNLRYIQELADTNEERFTSCNIPRQLTSFRSSVLKFLQSVYRFHRVAATHIFVLMISSEQRDRKPYALPVQCIPYTSLRHGVCRQLVNNLISEMTKRGMKVAGLHSEL